MNRPKDIPENVREIARELLGEPDTVTRPKNIERAARVLMAYGQRRADEAAARIAELEAEVERLRAQSETMRNILQEADKRIVWEHHGLGHDFTDRVEDVLND